MASDPSLSGTLSDGHQRGLFLRGGPERIPVGVVSLGTEAVALLAFDPELTTWTMVVSPVSTTDAAAIVAVGRNGSAIRSRPVAQVLLRFRHGSPCCTQYTPWSRAKEQYVWSL